MSRTKFAFRSQFIPRRILKNALGGVCKTKSFVQEVFITTLQVWVIGFIYLHGLRNYRKLIQLRLGNAISGPGAKQQKWSVPRSIDATTTLTSTWHFSYAEPQVEKSDSCQYLQTAQYRASCKQVAISVLDIWYRPERWRCTGIVQPQSWDQESANNRLRSNASTEPVQILVIASYRWTTSSQVTFRSRAGSRPCLCQHYDSTAPVLKILLRYWCVTKPVVNFYLFLNFAVTSVEK